jgi:DNA invertase Pin-like site-specific DNA recombinase
MKVIYLRVSNKDLSYDDQLPIIVKKFDIDVSKCLVLTEKISAFDEDSQRKRTEFIKLKKMIEGGEVEGVYVYKVDRLERNMKRMFTFFFFCEEKECRIYSAEEPMLNQEFEHSAQGDFLRYVNVLLFGTQAQGESENTSKRTRKAVRVGNVTTSSYGNKWGSKYRNLAGERIELTTKKIECIRRRIRFLLFEKDNSAKEIINDIAKRHEVKVSAMTISRVKNGKG